ARPTRGFGATVGGLDRYQAPKQPRLLTLGSSWCPELVERAGAEESPKHATERQRVAGRLAPIHTTTPPHEQERSRGGCGATKCGQVTPMVGLINGMFIVRGVARVDFGRTKLSQ